MDKDNLKTLVKKKRMHDMPLTGKYALLAEQVLETIWVYLSKNHSRNQITQNRGYHVHSVG